MSCYFGDAGGQFDRLAPVLAATAARQCPDWERRIIRLDRPKRSGAVEESYRANTHKLDFWSESVQQLPDGAEVLLIDADTVILRPLDDVWQEAFDVAYTVRPKPYKLPLNAGVVFLRVNDRSKAFLRQWADVNRRMLTDRPLHQKWRARFGGLNQAALGCVLASPPADLRLATLPCLEWNCEDSAWSDFAPARTRIVHVKSALRLAVFNLQPATKPGVRPLVTLWRSLERQALAVSL